MFIEIFSLVEISIKITWDIVMLTVKSSKSSELKTHKYNCIFNLTAFRCKKQRLFGRISYKRKKEPLNFRTLIVHFHWNFIWIRLAKENHQLLSSFPTLNWKNFAIGSDFVVKEIFSYRNSWSRYYVWLNALCWKCLLRVTFLVFSTRPPLKIAWVVKQ